MIVYKYHNNTETLFPNMLLPKIRVNEYKTPTLYIATLNRPFKKIYIRPPRGCYARKISPRRKEEKRPRE